MHRPDPGIEVMDLEGCGKNAVESRNICGKRNGNTGPIVLMAEAEHDKAVAALKEAGYIG